MTARYDVIVLDLDGTLLSPDGTVSTANRDAVDAARAAGVEIVIATGRALVESTGPLEAIEHDGVVVAAGGAMRCCGRTGQTLDRAAMDEALVHDVCDTLLAHGHKALLLKDPDRTGYDYLAVGPAELDEASQWWFEHMPVRVRFVHELREDPDPHDTVRAGAVATHQELGTIAAWLFDEIGERAFIQHWTPSATAAPAHLLEIFNPDVNKWTAVAAYCRERGINRQRVAAIGDGLNDVQIVGEAALGVAMGNAHAVVLDLADRVTGHHDADGVAHAIRQILAGAW